MATRLTGNSPRRTRRRVRRGRAARGAVRGRGALPRHVSREASEPPDSEEEENKEASEREASEVRLSTKRRRRIASQGASHRGLRPRPRGGPGRQPPRGARGPRRRSGRPPGHAARDSSGYEARQEARGDLPHSRCQRRRDIPVRDDVSQAKATKGAREAARGAREAARDAYGNCYCLPQWVPPFKQPILLPTFAASFLSLACAPFVEVAPLVDLTLAAAVSSVDNLQARHLGPSPPIVVRTLEALELPRRDLPEGRSGLPHLLVAVDLRPMRHALLEWGRQVGADKVQGERAASERSSAPRDRRWLLACDFDAFPIPRRPRTRSRRE